FRHMRRGYPPPPYGRTSIAGPYRDHCGTFFAAAHRRRPALAPIGASPGRSRAEGQADAADRLGVGAGEAALAGRPAPARLGAAGERGGEAAALGALAARGPRDGLVVARRGLAGLHPRVAEREPRCEVEDARDVVGARAQP